jgi:hypothetical protein
MDYIKIVGKIDDYIHENFDILEFLYLREGDCKYATLINHIANGRTLELLKDEIESFYRFQGMDNKARVNLLKMFDNENKNIKDMDSKDIDKGFNLYRRLLKKTKEITKKYQYVNTAKLMNLYNQNLPLFDNNVINFLNHFIINEERIKNRVEENYRHILNIYKIINEQKCVPNIIKLKNSIYSEMEIKHINLNKFVDTLMYFINDAKKIFEYKKLCINKKGQACT